MGRGQKKGGRGGLVLSVSYKETVVVRHGNEELLINLAEHEGVTRLRFRGPRSFEIERESKELFE